METLIDFFLPHFCPICGKVDEILCNLCERELSGASQICPVCGEESIMGWTHEICKGKNKLEGLISLFEYGDPSVRKVIDAIKYDFNKDLIPRLFEKIRIEVGVGFDYVVPVPLHYYRYNWRGFNQAELIAQVLGSQIFVLGERLLVRKKNTVQQVKMTKRKERLLNVKGVFDISNEARKVDLKDKKVLLVDDVFTTGASMSECCKVLKNHGVKVVWGFCLAH